MVQADNETLMAVVIGAVLATAGGFAASQLEAVLRKRERERNAALLFGEILSMLRLIMRIADQSRQRGDPYGPVTLRFLRAARRETEIYDRNRETLFDLRDATLRARIHTLVARITFSLDGVADTSAEIAALQARDALPDAESRLEALKADRHAAFDFVIETTEQIEPLLAMLAPLAKHAFDAHDTVARQAQPAPDPQTTSA